jgi:hypothetical protein
MDMFLDGNLAVKIVIAFFFLVFVVAFAIECDSCTDSNCPPGHKAMMVRGLGDIYECTCVIKPRRAH